MKIWILLLFVRAAVCAPAEDLIVDLPGLTAPLTSTHYSGYLQAEAERFNFYWFVESQSDPVTDPLIVWFNGGPGCSSLLGFLTELGPYTLNEAGDTLIENDYAWNLFANVLFIESPSCVGFSYDVGGNCTNNDDRAADMNYAALQDFFAKFPEYRNQELYIFGESYAGIYVPTLSIRVVEGNDTYPLNFKGFGIGNGLLSYQNNDNSLMFYTNYHAWMDPSLWNTLIAECCENGIENRFGCEFSNAESTECRSAVNDAMDIVYNIGINFYNFLFDCAGVSSASSQSSSSIKRLSQYDLDMANLFRNYDSPAVPVADPPCLDYTPERIWLNTEEVKEALHISNYSREWDVCSNRVSVLYTRQYFNVREEITFLTQTAGIKGVIFNGDTDLAVNLLGNEWDILLTGIPETENSRTWTVNGQVAGFVRKFVNLDFLTFKGSGHMVPEDKPVEALYMLNAILNDLDY